MQYDHSKNMHMQFSLTMFNLLTTFYKKKNIEFWINFSVNVDIFSLKFIVYTFFCFSQSIQIGQCIVSKKKKLFEIIITTSAIMLKCYLKHISKHSLFFFFFYKLVLTVKKRSTADFSEQVGMYNV